MSHHGCPGIRLRLKLSIEVLEKQGVTPMVEMDVARVSGELRPVQDFIE